jgi:signal transduction histidine kinase/CheY-like chemotaxis protein
MQKEIKKRFFGAAKGKVIIGFVFACFALLMAWGVSKFAFNKMLNTVAEISAPNDRLRIVNQLSSNITRLDQLQRDQAINNQGKNIEFTKASKILRKNLDTLMRLYAKDSAQLKRIKTINNLLADRDKQFLMYLQVRETLVNTKSFSQEVNKLSKLISERNSKSDSAVITKTSTSTTTLAPQEEEQSRGFLRKLFGKKKSDVYKIINEEYQVQRDTVNPGVEDSLVNNIESTLKTIETEQKAKSSRFVKRESDLATASALITRQMLNILHEVETEAMTQVDLNSAQAKQVVNKGIDQITTILIAFFILTIILVYLILTDITSINRYRKALEITKDEAEYHSKAKQRFLSNMSHEIRTPLQSILGYAELISQQEKPSKRNIDAIYQSSVHLLQIVNEVLDYNRIISGEFSFNNQPFSLEKILNEVVDVMRPLAEKKDLKLIANFGFDGVEFVEGDAFRLKQILFNLMGNAIKFTITGEITLALATKRQNDAVYLNFTINDTGIGFNEEDINKIFNEFEQIETKEKYLYNQTGTGLGLAIVKSLVEGQEGRINVRSKKNHGTTFTFHLKYQFAEALEIERQLEHKKINKASTGKVWVIDDDNLILELCSLIFEKNNIAYQSFNNANDILNTPVDSAVNYVFVDMRLPEMSGVELHRVLKNKMPKQVKFYAITAQVLPDEREAILSEGFEGLIMKPFRANDILSIFEKEEIAPIPKTAFDLTGIEKMTMGDEALMQKILNQFVTDCEADIAVLENDLETDNQDEARLIVHRLAGRTAQIGAAELAMNLRKLELDIATSLNEEVKANTFSAMRKIEGLVKELTSLRA